MFKKAAVLFFYAETPLHPGSGTSVGAVDLPIQRERFSKHPIIHSSGSKGMFRALKKEHIEANLQNSLEKVKLDDDKRKKLNRLLTKEIVELSVDEEDKIRTELLKNNDTSPVVKQIESEVRKAEIVFGPEIRPEKHGGAISFTDARVLLFPVRSLVGVFAWITCPTVLQRFKRDVCLIPDLPDNEKPNWGDLKIEGGKALVPGQPANLVDENTIVLEELTLKAPREYRDKVDSVANWLYKNALPQTPEYNFWRERLKSHLVILPDDTFCDFTLFSTEVIPRIRVEPTKGTVVEGGLWYEEHLPSETLLYTMALATEPKQRNSELGNATEIMELLETLVAPPNRTVRVQIGGDETVGRGIIAIRYLGTGGNNENARTKESK